MLIDLKWFDRNCKVGVELNTRYWAGRGLFTQGTTRSVLSLFCHDVDDLCIKCGQMADEEIIISSLLHMVLMPEWLAL